MPIETDLNIAPFWDDYSEEKNFHRILYRPGVPVQARELTQSQTILQNQIERFGHNIFKDGTIVSGANFSFDAPYPYIKILDLQTDGQPVNTSQYKDTIVKNSANLTAIVLDTADGLESQNPDLNTLFIKYLNKGVDGRGTFANSEVVSAFKRDYSVLSVEVIDAGLGYANDDLVVFNSSTGQGASARVVTNNTGQIQNIVVTSGGNNYILTPSITIANSSGGSSNGSGAILMSNNVVGQVTVAPSSFMVGANTEFLPTGVGYSFRVSEGIIFQKGFFIRVEPQNIVISKYSATPSNIHVGFETQELIVNNSVDTSLLDNSQGSPNLNAPGAYRLKLEPKLTVKTSEEAVASPLFFSLVEMQNGKPVRQKQTSEYNVLGQEMARRTAEESGNYVISPFSIISDEISSNTTHFQAKIGAGIAYVNGFRINQFDNYSVPLRKGTDVQVVNNVNISTNYGNYVIVDRVAGTFPFNTSSLVSLKNDTFITSGSTMGDTIGTARVRNLVFDGETNGVIRYRLYIYDIKMLGGKNFSDVKGCMYEGTGFPDRGAANFVLEASKAVLKESSFAPMLFRFGQKALRTLRGEGNINDTNYIYTTVDTTVNFGANGVLQKNLTGSDVFPYSGILNDAEERDIIFISRNSANTSSVYSGTVNISTLTTNVEGTGTSFLTNYSVGDYFIPTGGAPRRIINIANNTNMTVEANNSITNTAITFLKHYPANEVIPFTSRSNRTITASGPVLTASLGETLNTTLNATAIYNVQRSPALQLTKNINKNTVVKIDTSTNVGGNLGPWCLGHPDVHKLVSVLKTSNSDYVTSAVDVTSHFVIDNGQKDTHYGLSYIRKNSTSKLAISNTDFITVVFDNFTHTNTGGGAGFFSIDSYPVNDSVTPLPSTAIRTQDIPIYSSPVSGEAYDLRDTVDFRPSVTATANNTANLAIATTNPASTEILNSGEKFTPAVNKRFLTDIQYYQGRYDIVSLTSYGQYDVKEGVASDTPYPPSKPQSSMTIATIRIPPYPTLSTRTGSLAKRPDYTVKINTKQTKRYTMDDIGQIDNRLNRVEYYTALSLLEKQTSDLLIPSSIDPSLNRFKNGIFVEPFANFALSNVLDGEFTAGIDEAVGELIPRFTQNKFDLTMTGATNLVNSNNIVTLDYQEVVAIRQPYATRVRNCTENYWNFTGKVQLTPNYDNFYDVKKTPENTAVVNIDTASATLALITNLNNIKALNKVDTVTTTSQPELTSTNIRGNTNQNHWIDETYTTVQTQTTTETKNMLVGQVSETTQRVGDFITDISFSPYIREQAIQFYVTGMKPLTSVNAFFDKVRVTDYCQIGTTSSGGFRTTRAIGTGLMTDEQGILQGVFYIPASTFFVGDRELKFLDVNSLNSESAASTSAAGMFHAYNFSVTKNDLVVSTRTAEVTTTTSSSVTSTTTRDESTRSTFVEVPVPPPPPPPPPPPEKPVDPPDEPVFPPFPPIDDDTPEDPPVDPFDPPVDPTPPPPPVLPPLPPIFDPSVGGVIEDLVTRMIMVDGDPAIYQDPIAQTFSISRQQVQNQEGAFLTKVDLFFQRKDPNLGITVQLRTTNNGYPSSEILPLSSIHVKSSSVNISANASVPTTVHFEAPVFLKAGTEYCVVIIPDGNSPEYLIYTAQGGQEDLTNPSFVVRQDWGAGVLFTSTNNSAWQSIQDEDLKFTLYMANFQNSAGGISLTNTDDEFLTITPVINTFLGGEQVFKMTAPISGNVSFSTTSTTVQGIGTTFQDVLTPGSKIVLCDSNSPNTTSNYDIVTITSISSNTTLVLDSTPKFSANNVKILNTPTAKVFYFDPIDGNLTLTNSTAANNTFKFSNSDIIVGELYKGVTEIVSVDNKLLSYYQPLIYRTTISGTNITGIASFANSSLQVQAPLEIKFNDTNYLPFEAYVGSKSNEITAGSGKSVRLNLYLTSVSSVCTPVLDLQSTSLLRYENNINNDSTNEYTLNGNLLSKYVSKTVTLKENLDAEDVKVYLTGYQPTGTDIEVYIRALNVGDADNLRDKSWTKLTKIANTTCDSSNRNDFREFEYTFGDIESNTLVGVVSVNSGNAAITGIDTQFVADIQEGSVLRIGEGTTGFISKVETITDNNNLTLTDESPITLAGAQIHKVTNPKVMFKDPQNDGVVTYYSDSSRFDTYRTFAVKVGLKSQSTNLVPRVKDMSVLALSI